MQRTLPDCSAGFKRFEASMAPPEVAPAPMTVWISSMNRIEPGIVLDLLHDGLQPLLEVAAIARAGEQRAHVEREDRGILQDFRHLALDDLAGKTFGDGGLADAGIADEQRIVLLPAAQHLDRAQHLRLAADQRIDLAVARLAIEVDAIGVERVLAGFALLAFHGLVLVDAAHVARLRGMPGRLAMPWLMYWTASKRVISCSCRK